MRMCWSKRYSGSEMIGVSFTGVENKWWWLHTRGFSSQTKAPPPHVVTSTWWPKRTLMYPPESSMFSPSEVLTISAGNLIFKKGFFKSPQNQSAISRTKPTLQATGIEFNKELGLWFGQQSSHAIHDLYPSFWFTVWVWGETINNNKP